jgi:hypothetical protein
LGGCKIDEKLKQLLGPAKPESLMKKQLEEEQ